MFSRAIGADVFLPTAATGTGYTIPALSAAAAGRLIYSAAGAGALSLIHVSGFVNDQNNGLKPLADDPLVTETELTIAGLVAAVPSASTFTQIAVAGVRGAARDIEVEADGNLISTALDFTTLGIAVGTLIHEIGRATV